MGTRQTPLRRVADRVGLTQLGRRIYTRKLLKQGVHRVKLMGVPVAFLVESQREIDRIDSLHAEQDFMGRILEHAPPGGSFWDVGANIGVISLVLAKARPGVKVEAFEPEPRHAQRLRKNFELNGVADRCRVHEVALSNVTGSASFSVDEEIGSGSHSLDSGRQRGARAIEVKVRRGDEMAAEVGSPAALKIDVEGAEMLVLDGLRQTLSSGAVREVFIEIHASPLPLADGSADPRAILAELGFTCAWEQRRGTESHCHYRLPSRI